MTNEDLKVIARAIAETMAKADNGVAPDVEIVKGVNLTAVFAMTVDVAQFIVGTPFGSPVRVTISKAGGMFSG
jgi:hypothetical protein